MNIRVGAKSDVGRMRNDNQDSFIAHEPIFAVADGVGGHLGGDVASATAVRVIEEASAAGIDPDHLEDVLRRVNSAIWEESRSSPHLRGMGTTCTMVVLQNGSAHLAHVGDSRAYLYRAGELSQVTEDHNLVGRMVSEGRLSREEAAFHPQRNIITRALGLDEKVDVDLLTLELVDGDRLLACSDGLTAMVDEATITDVLSSEHDPQAAAERLVEAANQAGGEDNITVILLDVAGEGASGAAPVPSSSLRTSTPAQPAGRTRPAHAWRRRIAWALVVVVFLTGALVATRWFVLNHAWFVASDGTGVVTIYRGIPEEFAGLTLRQTQQQSGLKLSSLPSFLRPNVTEGIKVDSYGAAQTTIANLRQRAREFRQPAPKPSSSRNKKKNG